MLLVLYECIFSTCSKCTVVIPRMSQDIFVLNRKSLTRYRCLWCAAVTREAFLSEVVWRCTRTDRSVRMPSRGFDESFPSGCISARGHFLCFKKKKKSPRQKHPKTAKANYVHWTREKKCNILLVKFPRTVSRGEKVIAAPWYDDDLWCKTKTEFTCQKATTWTPRNFPLWHQWRQLYSSQLLFFFLYMISLFCEWISDCIIKTRVLLID